MSAPKLTEAQVRELIAVRDMGLSETRVANGRVIAELAALDLLVVDVRLTEAGRSALAAVEKADD